MSLQSLMRKLGGWTNLWSTELDIAVAHQLGEPSQLVHLQRLTLANTAQVHLAGQATLCQPGAEES
jgi:hypothetical protein